MTHSGSEDSTDDDVPIQCLAQSKRGEHPEVSSAMKELIRYQKEECEFCEEICYNKYNTLVHNASHILVPLKHSIPRCKLCNQLFESPTKLRDHNVHKHSVVPSILKNIVETEPVVKVDSSMKNLVIEAKIKDKEVLKTEVVLDTCVPLVKGLEVTQLINKLPVIRCDDTVTRLISGQDKEDRNKLTAAKNVLNVGVNRNPLVTKPDKVNGITDKTNVKLVSSDFVTKTPSIECDDIVTRLIMGDSKPGEGVSGDAEENATNIKSKIVFEDEMDDCDEDIINFNDNPPLMDLTQSDSDDNQEFKSNKIVLGSKVNNVRNMEMKDSSHRNEPIFEESYSPSVHYDDLMLFGLYDCKFCKKSFPNKYQKITHELIHMKIYPRPNTFYMKIRVCRYCDQYIAGNHFNLKRHHLVEHFGLEDKYQTPHKYCNKCSLRYYSYGRHYFKYHLLYTCKQCSKPFESESALNVHSSRCNGVKYIPNSDPRVGELRTRKVCNICSLFNIKNSRFGQQYRVVGDYSEMGKRVQCEACAKEFFEVKLLSYVSYQKNWQYHSKAKVPLTNETRLKNINQRLKKMKMMSKR